MGTTKARRDEGDSTMATLGEMTIKVTGDFDLWPTIKRLREAADALEKIQNEGHGKDISIKPGNSTPPKPTKPRKR